MKTTLLLFFSTLFSGCWSEDWIVLDRQARSDAMFWGVVTNFNGDKVSVVEFSLNSNGRTSFTVTSPPPVVEVKNVSVKGWLGFGGSRACDFDCQPESGDQVLELHGVDWPFVYRFEFE